VSSRLQIYIVLLLYFISLILYSFDSAIKYTVYVIPFILLVIFVQYKILNISKIKSYSDNKERISSKLLFFISILLLYNLLLLTLSEFEFLYRYIQETIFLITPLSFLIVIALLYKKGINNSYSVSIILLIVYILTYVIFVINHDDIFSIFIIKIKSFITSEFPGESIFSFSFGLLSVYYFIRKKYNLFIVSYYFTIVSGKRIAILAVLLVIVIHFILMHISINKKKYIKYLALAVNMLLPLLIYYLANGFFDDIFYNLTGMTVNQITLGRQYLYSQVFEDVNISIFGYGLGYTSYYLQYNSMHLNNLHSDILKYFLEFGVLIFPIVVFYIYKIFEKYNNALLLIIFTNIILFTDNITIYHSYTVLLGILIILIINDKNLLKIYKKVHI